MYVLSILGLGGAIPAQSISLEFLREVSRAFPERPEDFPIDVEQVGVEIETRATTLPLDFILKTGNRNPFTTHQFATESPTDLAYRAASQALQRAGVSTDVVGLVIGDSSTPMESTPSEGQRLGKRLGTKVPAFDVWGASSSFALHLSILMARKPESLPPYIVGASANVPTQSICYGGQRDGRFFLPQFLFGDAAASWVVSYQHTGKLLVRDAFFTTETGHSQQFSIDTYGFLGLDPHFYATTLAGAFERVFRTAFSKYSLDSSKVKLVTSYSNPREVRQLAAQYKIGPENCWFQQQQVGESLGSSPALALSEHWDDLKSGDSVIVMCAGAGLSYGYVLIEVR